MLLKFLYNILVAPLIVKKPEDVIVSMDNTTGKLASSAVFECIGKNY